MTVIADLHPEYIMDANGNIKAVIISLECLNNLLERINRYEQQNDEWDKQIATDTASGKLDFLLEEAQGAYDAGTLHFR